MSAKKLIDDSRNNSRTISKKKKCLINKCRRHLGYFIYRTREEGNQQDKTNKVCLNMIFIAEILTVTHTQAQTTDTHQKL